MDRYPRPGDFGEIEAIRRSAGRDFRFPLGLWTRIVYDYAVAYHRRLMSSEHLIKSLIPLYLGKTASFVIEAEDMDQEGAEAEIEKLCTEFEKQKEYLVNKWR